MKISVLLLSGVLSATSVFASFSTNFTGSAPWEFDSEVDPNGQLGGTDQLVYSGAASNGTAYVEKSVTTDYFGQQGTYYSSFQLDLSDFVTGTSDFNGNNIYTLTTASGNKGSFDSGGALMNFSVAGFNNPGELRFSVSGAVEFWNAGQDSTDLFVPGTSPSFPLLYDVVIGTTLEKSGTVWTVTHDLSVTGPDSGGTIVTNTAQSVGTRDRDSFQGWLAVDGVQLGFKPSGSTPFGAGNSIAIDDFTIVPEPSTYALLIGALALAGALWRKRR